MDRIDFSLMPGREKNSRVIKVLDEKPLISIITAYYNAEEYVFETAMSILNQTFPYFEWIIVNDGSTNEKTSETLERLKSLDKRIKVITTKNGGPAKARMVGVKEAISDIVLILDADDLIDKTMLECGYFTMLTNKEAIFAYTPIITFGKDNYVYNPKYSTKLEKKENLISVNAFIRKDKFLEVDQYDKLPKAVHEDWYMWLTFLSKGYKPLKMSFYGFWYRRLDTGRLNSINSSAANSNIAEKYLNTLRSKIDDKLESFEFPYTNNFEFSSTPKLLDFIYPAITNINDKKRILFILPWAVLGGADIFNLNLMKKLKNNGYEISVVTTMPMDYDLRQDFENVVDEFFDLTTFLELKDWAGFISHLISSRNINLVFQSNSFYGYHVIPWLKSIHKEVIFTDYIHAQDYAWRDGGYPRDSIAINSFLDKTYTCTKYLKNVMENEMAKKDLNVEVSYIGTDIEKFNPDIEFENETVLKEKYKGRKVIVFPCRITHVKRPLFMCEVMKELSKINKYYICLFIGDGELADDCKSFVKNNNLEEYIEFISAKKDIRVYYKIADITVVCSLTEGLTLTAYESLAMKVPVISSDVGGQSELITDKCGKIIQPYQDIRFDLFNYNYDAKEIKNYVDSIIEITNSDTYEDMKNHCRDIILADFSEDICLEKLSNNLTKLIDEGSNTHNLNIDENFTARYLTLFNEYYYKPISDSDRKLRNIIGDRLWKYPVYRGLVKFNHIMRGKNKS